MTGIEFRVAEIGLFERPVELRLPFRFGIVTMTHAPQAFVRVAIELTDGRRGGGAAAELMVPKWFDKDPAKPNERNFEQLRGALEAAREAYLDHVTRTAFGHFVAHYRDVVATLAGAGTPELAANFGGALIDRAIIDALGHAVGASFHALLVRNALGIEPARAAPDLQGFDAMRFLAARPTPHTVAVRHTVGLADRLRPSDAGEAVDDGLPDTLEAVLACHGVQFFKLKVAGDPEQDVQRLARIAEVLDSRGADYRCTLDGNEQYADLLAMHDLMDRLARERATARLARSILFVEQPAPRAIALSNGVHRLAARVPVIIDESDAALDAFVQARSLGYTGVSSKACKGVYRSLINAMRCAHWNSQGGAFFMSGEDLTTQAGLAVQQDLALATVLGIRHVERNGHHYVNGFTGQQAPPGEQQAFLATHRDMYEHTHGSVRLRIAHGELDIASLHGIGFASGAEPDWTSMSPLHTTAGT